MDQIAYGFEFGLGLWLALALICLVMLILGLAVLFASYLLDSNKKKKGTARKKEPATADLPDGVYFSSVFDDHLMPSDEKPV